tara:strand:- start:913 stop:1068 length:156 start_codon:yes stop_codon:yes gene_type:complete
LISHIVDAPDNAVEEKRKIFSGLKETVLATTMIVTAIRADSIIDKILQQNE